MDVARLKAKVLEDPYYRETYRVFGGIDAALRAGFFDDGLAVGAVCPNEDPKLLLTPIDKILKNLDGHPPKEKPVILVTTGSLAPLHQGHLHMMEEARAYFENLGRRVVGGYLVPSHDNYVTIKAPGMEKYTSERRVALAQAAVEDSSWLMVDPSEALFNPGDRNCTAVFARMKKYLSYHFGPEAFVYFYVFGSDLANFSGAFIGSGEDICVCRKETVEEAQKKLAPGATTLLLPNTHGSDAHSSTSVRQGKLEQLHPATRVLYQQWLSA